MRRTKEEAERTRQALLDAALRVFGRLGYAPASLDDIACEAGLTRGAIYHHFGGKAELYQALMAELQRPAAALVDAALHDERPPLERLRLLLARSLAYLEQDPAYRASMELSLFRTGREPDLEAGLAQKIAGQRALRAHIAELVRQAQATGAVRADADPQAAAMALLGLLNGVALIWLLDPQGFSPAAQAEALADTLLRGLAARDGTT